MPQRFALATLSLWPGLAQIWTGQEVLGLILAAVFTASLDLALLGGLLWTDWLPPGAVPFLAATAALTWLATLGYTLWWLWRCHPERHRVEIERLFRESLDHYLHGRWNEARRCCEAILTRDEDDVEAVLQLAYIHARTGRPDLARHAFHQCLQTDPNGKWRWEVKRALARIDREPHAGRESHPDDSTRVA
jgi:tetratricopeptide (TPR) repeat protein